MKNKIIFTNGVFDILTVSHINLLRYCREIAGEYGFVHIALDSDTKTRQDKGKHRPIFTYQERYDQILATSCVDVIYTFDSNLELYELIKKIQPDIIVKGGDWKGNVVGSDLAFVHLFQIDNRYSSTKIINRILDKYNIKKEV
jgi:rfaE bifunctional protein nucleotidyltransferase chain/domain